MYGEELCGEGGDSELESTTLCSAVLRRTAFNSVGTPISFLVKTSLVSFVLPEAAAAASLRNSARPTRFSRTATTHPDHMRSGSSREFRSQNLTPRLRARRKLTRKARVEEHANVA